MARDESDFSHSLADLMTSLAIVFLILAVAMVVYAKLTENNRASEFDMIIGEHRHIMDVKKKILDRILKTFEVVKRVDQSLTTDNNCISIDGDSSPYKITIRFSSDEICKSKGFFYGPDEYLSMFNSNNTDTVKKLIVVYDHLCSKDSSHLIDHVQILGHTDDDFSRLDKKNCEQYFDDKTPENSLHCQNIFLSAQRARDIFLRVGGEIKKQNSDSIYTCFKTKTEISGRGPFDPETQKLTDKEKKRRVEIVINFTQPRIIR